MKKSIICLFTVLITSLVILESNGQNIKEPRISDFKWLAGNWVGDGFGGVSQEAWTEPSANSMVGVYKHYKDGQPTFYEIITILEIEGKISLRLKHLNPDMTGWEEKDKFVEFPFVSATPTKIEFKGLIYELIDENKMDVSLKLKRGDKVSTEVFHFERRKI